MNGRFFFWHKCVVHLIKSIAVKVDVDIVGDIYVRMAQESGKDFDVHAVVIAVRGEGVPKDMFAAKLYASLPACADGLIAQGFVGKAFSIVGGEDPL